MADVTIRLVSGDWYWVTGHGAVVTFERRIWPFYPAELNGQEVEIDNKRFLVRGVEMYAIHWHPGADWPIGLLVEPLDDTRSSDFWGKEPQRSYEKILAKHSGIGMANE